MTTELELGLIPRGRKSFTQVDYSALDRDTIEQALIDHILATYPEQKDAITSTGFRIITREIAYIADLLSYRADYLANNNFISTVTNLRALDNLLALIGYRRSGVAPAATDVVIVPQETVGDTTVLANSTLTIRIPARTQVTGVGKNGASVTFELFPSPANIFDDIEIPTGAANKLAYAVEGSSKTFQAKGDGSRFLKVTLPDFNVIPDTIRINVGIFDLNDPNRGTTYQPNLPEWERADFLVTHGTEAVYAIKLRPDGKTDVIFGDGTFGNLVPKDQDIIVNYRVGGGANGNIPAQNLNGNGNFPVYKAGVKTPNSMKCAMTNVSRGVGGHDEESIEQAKFLAPLVYQAQKRMVKDIDYAALALKHPKVSKVVAVSRQDIVIDTFQDETAYVFALAETGTYTLAFDLHKLDDRSTKTYQANIKLKKVSYTNINELVIDLNSALGWTYDQTTLAFKETVHGEGFIAHFDVAIEGFIELWIITGDYSARVTLLASGNSVLPILHIPYGGYGRVDANYVDMHILSYAEDGTVAVPNVALVNELRTYFEQFKMLQSEVIIRRGFIQQVDITGDVFIERSADPIVVRDKIDQALRALFAGDTRELGEALYVSQVYEAVTKIEGVAYVDEFSPSQNVIPDQRTLLQLGNLDITFYEAR